MSDADTQGNITYANATFVDVCGFEYSELLGQPHNVVRHPDMPQKVFADMWATMKAGYSWTGVVKNRRKNGDHYWVRANATPIERDDGAIGYMSVHTSPTPQEVQDWVGKVDVGVQQVVEAERTMSELVAQVGKATGLIGGISDASSEQSNDIGQVNQAVTQLDHATQQNAALVEEAAAAAAALSDQASMLSQSVQVFRQA